MAHATRGRRSGTYEIQEVLHVDLDALTITYRHAGAYAPAVARLRARLTPAARQLLRAMAASIKIRRGADADAGWESAKTLAGACWYGAVLLEKLDESGVDDFSDARIDVPLLRGLYDVLSSSMKRSACHLLARVVEEEHPDGRALAIALKNTRFGVDDTQPYRYDEATSAAIERCARAVFLQRYRAQRDLFERLGHDVSNRSWLTIPAQQLLDWARTFHPEQADVRAPQPLFGASYEQQVAWALTHPSSYGYVKGQRPDSRPVRHPSLVAIGEALYPDNVTLTAGLVLHCLGENSGYNHSVLLEKNIDSLTHLGPDHALEHNVKARNHSYDTRPTRTSSMFAPGGLIETLTGLTRFSRAHRAGLTNPDGTRSTVVDRLYVEHVAHPAHARVLDLQRQQSAWRSNPQWDEHWDEANLRPRGEVPLRFAALRLVALARVLEDGLRADVHGHSERTRVHYLAHVLPNHVLNAEAAAAQDDMHEQAVRSFQLVTEATNGPALELATASAVMDVEIGACTTAGTDPDEPSRPCSLGISACFTCPNGYRTVDHLPGLLAAVEFSEIVQRNDPHEWSTGEASALHFFAQQSIDQFPRLVVENVRRHTDLRPHIATVAGRYMELRHG